MPKNDFSFLLACPCPRVGGPVCGENGKEYHNACLAKCDGVEKKCDGKCPCQKSKCKSQKINSA